MLSPSLLEKVSYVGTLLKSFRQGDVAIKKLLEIALGHKRLERITERIGAERLVEADQEVIAFKALTLTEKLAGPKNVRSPVSAAVMADGGRYQRCEKNESGEGDHRTHWFEDKAGLCLELGGRRGSLDCFRRSSKHSLAMAVRGSGRSSTSTSARSTSLRCWTSSML